MCWHWTSYPLISRLGNSFNESMFRQLQNAPSKGLKDLVNDLGEGVVMVRTPIGLGSGFIIHPEGYVVTNDHVIAGERKISITQFKQARSELTKLNFDNARIVATGGNLDLALLKIEGSSEEFPTVPLGESIDVGQGERVFAIGSPLGLERSVSEGIVSLRNRIISDRLHVQTTAEISPQESGGPLFNYKGEVVGVNNMKVVAQGAEGFGFAIPKDSLKTFLANRDAYAFDPRNPNAGFRYNQPPRTSNKIELMNTLSRFLYPLLCLKLCLFIEAKPQGNSIESFLPVDAVFSIVIDDFDKLEGNIMEGPWGTSVSSQSGVKSKNGLKTNLGINFRASKREISKISKTISFLPGFRINERWGWICDWWTRKFG